MIMAAREDLRDIIRSIYRRKGGKGVTLRLFDDLGSAERHLLLEKAALGIDDIPVIGLFIDEDNWLLLSTEYLLWCTSGKTHRVCTSCIADANVDLGELRMSKLSMADCATLQVITKSGKHYRIEVEAGRPLSGLWNVLKFLGRRSSR